MSVLAIDAGTTGVTAIVLGSDQRVLAHGYAEFEQHFPQPGWVEHDPEQIWQALLEACRTALKATDREGLQALGLTNQRETAVLWDRTTLRAPRHAIVWQDRRTSDLCADLRDAGHEDRVSELTGLRLDPYFTATKLTWLAGNDSATWSTVTAGATALGTVDSYLIARLTAGRVHATDPSNASRTLLMDLTSGQWSSELCELFGVPISALPGIRPSTGDFGHTDPAGFLGLDLPIRGVAGDQQAALFGQRCLDAGQSKCTYGTGSFVLVNTGTELVRSMRGLLTTVAWDLGNGLTYALEGSIFVTGAAIQWLRDGLGIIDSAAASEALARTVTDSGGVVFVPALTGLGAPYWDPAARGVISGITRGTTRAHLTRAALDAIAFEVRDVIEAMAADGIKIEELVVDGGATRNDLLCELQATQLQRPVRRSQIVEATAFGAGLLAGLGAGLWSDLDGNRLADRSFAPGVRDDGDYDRWQAAIRGVVSSTRGHGPGWRRPGPG